MIAYLIFIVSHLILVLGSISINAVSVAFPEMASSLNTSLVTSGWVLSVYLLVFTVSSVLMGKINEIFGKKQTFLACTVFFILGSFLCAIAPNIQILIIARVIQGIGGGGFSPSMMGIIADIFPNSRQKAVGISIGILNIGGIIGPSIGAWLVSTFSWRSVFWFNVPVGILSVIPLIFLLKSSKGTRSHIDFVGSGLLAGVLLAIMLGLTLIKSSNSFLLWALVGILLALGVILVILFIRHEKSAADPVVEWEFLRRKPFFASNVASIIFGASLYGVSSFVPLFGAAVFSMSAAQSGVVLTLRSVGTIAATMVTSLFLVRWGYRKPLIISSVISSLTIIIIGLYPESLNILGNNYGVLAIWCVTSLILGIGIGVGSPALVNSVVDLNPSKASVITGVGSMFRQGGGALSIAIITLLVQSIGNDALGFKIAFVALGIVVLVTIPFLMAMPARPVPAARYPGETEKA